MPKPPSDGSLHSFYRDLIDVNGDGRVMLYQREDAKKKGIWTARLRVKGARQTYVVRSTKESKLELAKQAARELYEEAVIRVRMGIDTKVGTFADVYQQWWEGTDGQKSESRRRDQRNEARRYFFPFFGDKKFDTLQERDIEGFWRWRIDFWTKGPGKKLIAEDRKRIEKGKRQKSGKRLSSRGNVAQVPSQKTLDMTASHLREVWKYAVKHGKANRVLEISAKKLITKKKDTGQESGQYGAAASRRSWFEPDEYRKLTTYMRRWASGKGDDDDRTRLTQRHLYGRRLLRDYFLFLANSGLRTGEADQLRWRNVQFDQKVEDGTVCDVLNIESGKTGARRVILRDQAGKVLRRRAKENEGRFTKKSDFVFCRENGKARGELGKVFSGVLEHLGMRRDAFGQKRSLYSARHQYATMRLKYGKKEGLSDHELAQNMGTSITYLHQHYSHKNVEDAAKALVARRG